jgi:secreted Zn-dependent insulinase-like peptidase
MTDTEFEEYRQGILVRKEEPDQRLSIQAGKFWSEISLRDVEEPLFDRYEREVKFLRSLKKEEFLSFCKQLLDLNGDRRRLLISQITSQKNANKEKPIDKYVYQEINDELAFLQNQPQL